MYDYPLLSGINSPEDLKRLEADQIPSLCAEIREFLIESISKTGGHLASNLGAVELTVAAHRVFSTPTDCIMFDVGHQCYIHKIITGRRQEFHSLRTYGGISGFLRPGESVHDCFVSGHASNSVSACLGLSRAKSHAGDKGRVVCVIGDGALTGGMVYEAMNDAGQSGEPLIIIFNDNEMSISRNVGAIAQRLREIRLKPRYLRAKARTKAYFLRFGWGERMISRVSAWKSSMRRAILKETIFEIMGFRYLGPADGHDEAMVEMLLKEAAELNKPVVVHLKTVKGKGYYPSEKSPGDYHGVSAFDIVEGAGKNGSGVSFSSVFGGHLKDMASRNGKICAVTAAMEANTGLSGFGQMFPGRFYDVGIAEEHAVTMAAGLAAGGMIPVCAIYSTFLQRGYDQLIHDVAINGNHVVFAVDRAGLVGADGQTHQGAFDVPYLLSVPGMAVYSPSSFNELKSALDTAIAGSGPAAVRYPRGGEGSFTGDTMGQDCAVIEGGSDITLVSYGIMINQALSAAETLARSGISAEVIKVNRLDKASQGEVLASARKTGRLIVLEDCVANGCLGHVISAAMLEAGIAAKARLLNLGQTFVPEGSAEQLYKAWKIDADAVVSAAGEMVSGYGTKA